MLSKKENCDISQFQYGHLQCLKGRILNLCRKPHSMICIEMSIFGWSLQDSCQLASKLAHQKQQMLFPVPYQHFPNLLQIYAKRRLEVGTWRDHNAFSGIFHTQLQFQAVVLCLLKQIRDMSTGMSDCRFVAKKVKYPQCKASKATYQLRIQDSKCSWHFRVFLCIQVLTDTLNVCILLHVRRSEDAKFDMASTQGNAVHISAKICTQRALQTSIYF